MKFIYGDLNNKTELDKAVCVLHEKTEQFETDVRRTTKEDDEYIFNEKIDKCVFNILYTIFFGMCPLILFMLLIKALDGRYEHWAHACILLCVYPVGYIAFLLIKLITLIVSLKKNEGPQEK